MYAIYRDAAIIYTYFYLAAPKDTVASGKLAVSVTAKHHIQKCYMLTSFYLISNFETLFCELLNMPV